MKKRALVFATIMMTAAMGMTAYAGSGKKIRILAGPVMWKMTEALQRAGFGRRETMMVLQNAIIAGADGTNLNSYDEQTPDGCTLDEYGRWGS